jgi:peptidoglycan/xylan/chitin deacetylase (PgdA/CDA1 family)
MLLNKKLIGTILQFYPLSIAKKIFESRLLIVNYHSIQDVDVDPIINKNSIYRSQKGFEKDMIFFLKHFKIISVFDLLEHIKHNKKLPKLSLIITVDDGLRCVYESMFPIFNKYGIPATVFLNSAFIDNKDLHFERKANILIQEIQKNPENRNKLISSNKIDLKDFRATEIEEFIKAIPYQKKNLIDFFAAILEIDFKNYLNKRKPYLDSDQIFVMLKNKITIGAHSIDHPNYSNLALNEQIKQTIESIDFLQKKFNIKYRLFAFPYGDNNIEGEFFRNIRHSVDATFGTAGIKKESYDNHFQRFEIENSELSPKTAMKIVFMKNIIINTFHLK